MGYRTTPNCPSVHKLETEQMMIFFFCKMNQTVWFWFYNSLKTNSFLVSSVGSAFSGKKFTPTVGVVCVTNHILYLCFLHFDSCASIWSSLLWVLTWEIYFYLNTLIFALPLVLLIPFCGLINLGISPNIQGLSLSQTLSRVRDK